jgi:hypothetical protein
MLTWTSPEDERRARRRRWLATRLAYALVAAALLGTGCVSNVGYSVSSSTSIEGKAFEIDGRNVGFLMLTMPDLDASEQLRAKCPTGRTSNVVTQATMRNWFGLLQVYEVVIRGVCHTAT